MDTLGNFPQFTRFPLEIRRRIWNYTLPGPRVMLVLRSESRKGAYITAAASYGGHQPQALHVNSESRAEALLHLTPRFGTYWNLDIDALYIEATDNAQLSVTQFAEMAAKGKLAGFKHVAIDWTIWNWKGATDTMEFRVSFTDGRFDGYEDPLKTIATLPELETCTFIHTLHTLQSSLVKPYCPWSIGPLTGETTLDEDGYRRVATIGSAAIRTRIEFLGKDHTHRDLGRSPGPNSRWISVEKEIPALNVRPEIEFSLKAIHGRDREVLPVEKLYRRQAGWEMDWFG